MQKPLVVVCVRGPQVRSLENSRLALAHCCNGIFQPMVGTLTHMLSLHSLCVYVCEGKGGVKTNAWL